jgi:hypothetical protein
MMEDPAVRTIQRNGAIFLIGMFVVVPLVIIYLWLTGQLP